MYTVEDIVSHHTFGVGRIVDVVGDPPTEFVIKFVRDASLRRMSVQVAARGLVRLPANGLEAVLLDNPDAPKRWVQEAPLKLLAAALIDLGGRAKPSELQHKIDRGQLLGGNWESWWKRVQPATKASPHFVAAHDGTYLLRVAPEDVPEAAIVSPKRRPEKRLTGTQFEEMLAGLETGRVQLVNLGAENARAAIRALIDRRPGSNKIRQILTDAITGPVPLIRMVLDEALKADRAEPEDMLLQLVSLVRQELHTPRESSSPDGEYILARVKIISDSISRLAKNAQGDETLLAHQLAGLSLDLAPASGGSWRLEAMDEVVRVVLAVWSAPRFLSVFVSALCSSDAGIERQQAVVSDLVAKVFRMRGHEGLPSLIQPLLTTHCVELAERALSRDLDDKSRVLLVELLASRAFADLLPVLPSLARILHSTRHDSSGEAATIRLNLALTLGTLSPHAGTALEDVLRQDLLNLLDRNASSGQRGPVIEAIQSVLAHVLDQEHSESERLRLERDAELRALTQQLTEALKERADLRELARELQSGYRGLRERSLSDGKREALLGLSVLYQETLLAQGPRIEERSNAAWILAKMETLLRLQGASRFGENDTVEPFNPSRHEALPGHRVSLEKVRVVCPGFECLGLEGERVVLVRAKVTAA